VEGNSLYLRDCNKRDREGNSEEEKKRKGEHFGHTEGSRHLNVNLHSNMKYGDELEDTYMLRRPCVRERVLYLNQYCFSISLNMDWL